MKHSYFKTSMCLVLSFFLLLSSCQKQIDTQFEEPVLKENFKTEAQTWFANGPVLAEKKILDLPFSILPENAPKRLFARMGKLQKKMDWDNAELFNKEGVHYLVVPVTQNLKKYGNDYEIARSLVFYKKKGDEMKMNIIEALSKKGTSLQGKSKEIIATAFLNNIKNKTDQITGINAEVFIYSEEYKIIGNYEFKNGVFALSTKKLKIDNKSGNNNNQTNSGINTESGSCQTWYVVYDEYNQNGELVYWTVLYSYQTGNCGGGGNPEEEMPEGEGGGGAGYGYDNVYNLMQDPCKTAALNAITSININNTISNFYNSNILPTNSPIDVVFVEQNLTGPGQSALVPGYNNLWQVELSNHALYGPQYMSQEAWGAVIAHEILHIFICYFRRLQCNKYKSWSSLCYFYKFDKHYEQSPSKFIWIRE